MTDKPTHDELEQALIVRDTENAALRAHLATLTTAHQQAVEALAGVRKERDRLRDVKWSGITDLENRVIALEAALKQFTGICTCGGKIDVGADGSITAAYDSHKDTCVKVIAKAALHGTGGQ